MVILNKAFDPRGIFYSIQSRIPDLQASPYDPHLDHEWHQYENLEWTGEETEVEGFWELVVEKGGVETGWS